MKSQYIEGFFEKFKKDIHTGRLTNAQEFNSISKYVENRIPIWYKDLLLSYPIAGLEIGVPSDFGQPFLQDIKKEDLPLMRIRFYDLREVEKEATNFYPGIDLIKKGVFDRKYFIPIALDEESTLESLFISNKKNPKVRLIIHDLGESKKELIKRSEVISDNFHDLFKYGSIINQKRKFSTDKKIKALRIIRDLLEFLKSQYPTLDFAASEKFLTENKSIDALLGIENQLLQEKVSISQEIYDKLKGVYSELELHPGDLLYLKEKIKIAD